MSIICQNEGVRLSGTTLDILQDLVNVIHSVKLALSDRFPQDEADKIIALCGQLAYCLNDGDEEVRSQVFQELASVLSESE